MLDGMIMDGWMLDEWMKMGTRDPVHSSTTHLTSYCPIALCFRTLGKPKLHAQLPFGPKKHWSFARAHVFMTFG